MLWHIYFELFLSYIFLINIIITSFLQRNKNCLKQEENLFFRFCGVSPIICMRFENILFRKKSKIEFEFNFGEEILSYNLGNFIKKHDVDTRFGKSIKGFKPKDSKLVFCQITKFVFCIRETSLPI